MKKALIVTRVSGFVPQFEMNNVKILQHFGYEVHYAANFDTVVYGPDNSRLDGTGIICHHIPFCRSPFSPVVRSCYLALKRLMRDESFDLIHCHMPMTGVITRIAAQSVRRKERRLVPVLYTTHGFHFYTGAPLQNWLYYLPERWLARCTDCLITINEEDYRRACTFPIRGRVEKISGVGIQITAEKNDASDPAADGRRQTIRHKVRQEFGFGDTDFVLVSVGELNANKNHIQILRMLTAYRDPALKYIICGTGNLLGELKRFVTEHSLETQVVFAGYRSDVEQILTSSDLFVFPSLREGLSVAVMEAMRAGLPVVAKQIRGNVDLIQNEKGGILVEKGEPSEYAKAIRHVREHGELACQMGTWNQERILSFSSERTTEQMRNIYQKTLLPERT